MMRPQIQKFQRMMRILPLLKKVVRIRNQSRFEKGRWRFLINILRLKVQHSKRATLPKETHTLS